MEITIPEKKAVRCALIGHAIFLVLVFGSWSFQHDRPIIYTDSNPTIQVRAITEEQLETLLPKPIEPPPKPAPEPMLSPPPVIAEETVPEPIPEPKPAPEPPPPPKPLPPKPTVLAQKELKSLQALKPAAPVKEEPKVKPDFSSAEEKKKKEKEVAKELAQKEKALAKEKEKEKAVLLAKEKEKAAVKEKQLAAAQKEKQKKAEQAAAKQAIIEAKAAEEARKAQAAAKASELAAEKDKLIASIQRKVRSQWINQIDYRPDLTATLKLHLDEKGEIIMIDVVESSGDDTFDRQAKLAAQRSAPFQLPEDPALAREFKTLVLPFQKG